METLHTTCVEMRKYESILRSLKFKEIDGREMAVELAHARTFEWALSGSNKDIVKSQSSNFFRWLQQGSGVFWISMLSWTLRESWPYFFHIANN